MPTKEEILFIVRMRDEASRVLAKQAKGFTALGNKADFAKKKAAGLSGVLRTMKGAVFSLQGAFLSLGASIGVGFAIDAARQFQKSLTEIVSLVGIARDEVDGMGEAVLGISRNVGRGPEELAKALFFITSAGQRGAQALDTLNNAAMASAAGLGETAEIANIATAAVNSYGAANLSSKLAVAILIATAREGQFVVAELAASMGRALPISVKLGVEMHELGAGIAFLTRGGINATEAVTKMNAIFLSFLKPAPKVAKILKDNQVSLEALQTTLREDGLLAALKQLQGALPERAFNRFFSSSEALVAVLAILGENTQDYIDISKRMADVQENLVDVAFKASRDSSAKLDVAQANLSATMVELGGKILPIVADAAILVATNLDAIGSGMVIVLSSLAALGLGAASASAGVLTLSGALIAINVQLALLPTRIALAMLAVGGPAGVALIALSALLAVVIQLDAEFEASTEVQRRFNDLQEEAIRITNDLAEATGRNRDALLSERDALIVLGLAEVTAIEAKIKLFRAVATEGPRSLFAALFPDFTEGAIVLALELGGLTDELITVRNEWMKMQDSLGMNAWRDAIEGAETLEIEINKGVISFDNMGKAGKKVMETLDGLAEKYRLQIRAQELLLAANRSGNAEQVRQVEIAIKVREILGRAGLLGAFEDLDAGMQEYLRTFAEVNDVSLGEAQRALTQDVIDHVEALAMVTDANEKAAEAEKERVKVLEDAALAQINVSKTIQGILEDLKFETSLIGKNNLERRISITLRRAEKIAEAEDLRVGAQVLAQIEAEIRLQDRLRRSIDEVIDSRGRIGGGGGVRSFSTQIVDTSSFTSFPGAGTIRKSGFQHGVRDFIVPPNGANRVDSTFLRVTPGERVNIAAPGRPLAADRQRLPDRGMTMQVNIDATNAMPGVDARIREIMQRFQDSLPAIALSAMEDFLQRRGAWQRW